MRLSHSLAIGSLALALGWVSAQGRVQAWQENAQYAARLAVTYCHTDTECEHAADVAEEYGVRGQLYFTAETFCREEY